MFHIIIMYLTYLQQHQKSETQGLTVIEAMASNIVPVVIEDEAFNGTVIDNLNGYSFQN